MELASEAFLIDRLIDSHRKRRRVVFLLGAGVSLPPVDGAPGVPGAPEVVRRVQARLPGDGSNGMNAAEALTYQQALGLYRQARGQRGIDELVRELVLEACVAEDSELVAAARSGDLDACGKLERDTGAWGLPPGLEALGRLLSAHPETLGSALLTTNFDPLVGVAVRKAGGISRSSALYEDGRISSNEGDGCHIVHVHGRWAWRGYTAHTVDQLTKPRPRLQRDLERFLENSDLVVLGYGGWEDVFSQVTGQLILDPVQDTEILWCFYESDPTEIEQRYPSLLQRLAPGLETRVVAYGGIDCNEFLPGLEEALGTRSAMAGKKPPRIRELPATGSGQATAPVRSLEDEMRSRVVSLGVERKLSPFIAGPPITDDEHFFGRWQERLELGKALGLCQPVQIIGERRMGKTSMLHWAFRHAENLLPGWPIAWVDAGAMVQPSPVALVQSIAVAVGAENKVDGLLDQACGKDVSTNSSIAVQALNRLLPLVLLVDEASALAGAGQLFDPGFLGALRALGQRKQIAWVSTSPEDLRLLFRQDHLNSPFLNDSIHLMIGQLEIGAAKELLQQGLDSPISDLVLSGAGQLPYPLQLWATTVYQGEAGRGDGDSVRDTLVPVFDSWWRWRSAEERELLVGCVEGIGLVGLESAPRRALRRLVRRGLVVEEGERFTLPGAAWRSFVRERRDE
ncbi:MAG: SIR2 family protein [Acidobacteriota bacterium]|nr:SIR2 family protein [Acidobacteriota bacterium]